MAAGKIEINRDVAAKVLAVVDKGLSSGVGEPKPGFMCVEAAVCFALGLPHGDDPACVARAVRSLKICLNDKNWSSKAARAKGLRRLALAQLGSAGVVNDHEFAKRLAELAIRKCVPAALRSAASIQKDPAHKSAMLQAASRCEKEGSREAAIEGKNAAAYAAAYAAAARRLRRHAAYAAAAAAAASAADAAYAAYLRRLRRLRRRRRRRRRRRHQKNRSR
jgi:hypothetical protein